MCTTTNVRRKFPSSNKTSVEGISPTSYLPSTSPSCLHHSTHPENLCATIASVPYHDFFHCSILLVLSLPPVHVSVLVPVAPCCWQPVLHVPQVTPCTSNPHSGHCSKFISRKEIKHCAITALITNSINTVLSVACPRVTTLEVTFSVSTAAPAPGWYRFALCRYEIFYRTQQLAAVSTTWQGKQPGMRESLSASPLKICPNLVVRNYQKPPGPACDAADAGNQPSLPSPPALCPPAPLLPSPLNEASAQGGDQNRADFPFFPQWHQRCQSMSRRSWLSPHRGLQTPQERLVPQARGAARALAAAAPQHPLHPPLWQSPTVTDPPPGSVQLCQRP